MATDDQEIVEVRNFDSDFGFEVDVLHTQESLELQEQRDEDFGLGTFEELCRHVADMVGSFVDDMKMEADYSQNCICFKFIVPNQRNAAYLIGTNQKNIECLQTFMQSQQIYPQNRLLKVEVEKEQVEEDSDYGQVQTFWDSDEDE